MSCRHCAYLFEAAIGAADGRAFPLPGDQPRWGRPRPFPVESTSLKVRLHLAERAVDGVATLEARRVDRTRAELELDAIDLDVSEIVLLLETETLATYRNDGRTLRIDVPLALDRVRVRITYRCTPWRGLYFVTRRELRAPMHEPNAMPTEVWSQGQDEDNRHWFPCQDHPGARTKLELEASVPSGMTVLGNGVLTSKRDEGEWTTFCYRQDEPLPPYLVTLAAGRFAFVLIGLQ